MRIVRKDTTYFDIPVNTWELIFSPTEGWIIDYQSGSIPLSVVERVMATDEVGYAVPLLWQINEVIDMNWED